MKSLLRCAAILLLLTKCSTPDQTEDVLDPSLSLWYDKPAVDWNEALPVGNGRLGAMVYGGTASDTLQFNEETLWTGQPHDYAHEGAHEILDELRELLWDGRQAQAQELAMERFMSKPLRQLSYQPFGKVLLT
ncbi:MAG: glycoside hydrolase N-terminal domain-containing protein, partial [Bacteroidota bacterium]